MLPGLLITGKAVYTSSGMGKHRKTYLNIVFQRNNIGIFSSKFNLEGLDKELFRLIREEVCIA